MTIVKITIVGANANNGLNARPFTLNVNNATSNVNVNIGSGNLYEGRNTLLNKLIVLTRMVEYKIPLCVGRATEDSGITRR